MGYGGDACCLAAVIDDVHDAVFPDLRGLSARDALHALTRLGMTGRLNGAGTVTGTQIPVDKGALKY